MTIHGIDEDEAFVTLGLDSEIYDLAG